MPSELFACSMGCAEVSAQRRERNAGVLAGWIESVSLSGRRDAAGPAAGTAALHAGMSTANSQRPTVNHHGVITTLMHSSCLSRNVRYISGASSSVARCVITNDGSISPLSMRCMSGRV